MITNAAIANALGQRLATLSPALPIAWPNKDLPLGTALPYLIFDFVPVSRTDATIAGGFSVNRGFVMVTVVSAINGFASYGAELAEDVAALFPFNGTRIAATGGTVTITQPPEVMQGYSDDVHWRTPVKISYRAP